MRHSAERWVAALGLAGGLLLLLVTPPFQAPDEPAHFLRIYQIAAGVSAAPGPAGAPGIVVPASLVQAIDLTLGDVPFHPEHRLRPGAVGEAWRLPLAPAATCWVPAGRLSPYAPAPYLGAAAAVAAGRLAGAGPLALLYLARLGNLALALLLCWAAVRWVPLCRWGFALIALTPMAMFERSSASADALTDALALLVVSLVLRLALGDDAAAAPPAPAAPASAASAAPDSAAPAAALGSAAPPVSVAAPELRPGAAAVAAAAARDRRQRAFVLLLLAAAGLLAAVKAVYFLLDGLIFLVPAERLGSRRRVLLLRGGGIAALALGIGVSRWVANQYFTFGLLREGVRPLDQLAVVLAAPLRFVGLAFADYLHGAVRYAAGCVGVLGWADTPLPRAVLVGWALLLVAASLTGGRRDAEPPRATRPVGIAVLAATLLLLSLSQYLAWTPVGAARIDGLQGRYFLPLLPLGAVLLANRRLAGRWPDGAGAGLRLGGASVAVVLVTLACLWYRYHGLPFAGAAGPLP